MPINTLGASTYGATGASDQNTIKKSNYSKKAQISTSGNDVMSMSDFYKIMAAQIQYQDADNPMDTSQMLAQMVQTQMIQSINQMSQINLTTYASSMVGQEVRVAKIDMNGMFDGEVTGVVTGVDLYGSEPIIYIDDKGYTLSQIMSVGKTPSPDAGDDKQDPDAGDGEGGANVPDVPDGEGGSNGSEVPDGPNGNGGADVPDVPDEGNGSGGTDGGETPDGNGDTQIPDGSNGNGGTVTPDGSGGNGSSESDSTGQDGVNSVVNRTTRSE